ncbi:protein kintoun [Symphorus nematophorus]
MEVGDKLKELNMTVDEIDRLTKAFKDEKFREMLRDYAEELSDPENKKRYEEEITLLEQERGNTIEFIHPQPFRALRTSVNGKQKCFINICANEKVGKPSSKWGVSEEGRRGQCWSLPHSLHPGRQDTDTKGNKIMIYDVIFHPDTLHIASKNKRFMEMVDSTAIQGIQSAFKVTLDKNNVREMSTKYKGTPQPCVIRKPIPGYKPRDPSGKPDPLAFPYPDEKQPITTSQTKPAESPEDLQIQPQKPKEPTKPNNTVKYRSFIDLQDFRYSRDSAQSPRPKEIVVTIDVPLLKAVTDASLEVKEGRLLLLESKKPAYRLELPLAYPVDEDKGEAKFNKQRGQLTVTLPVLPLNESFDLAVGPAQTSISDGKRQGVKSEVEDEDNWKGERSEKQRNVKEEEERDTEEEDLKQQTMVENGEEEKEKTREGENSEREEVGVDEKKLKGERGREEEDLKQQTMVETDPAFLQHRSSEAVPSTPAENNLKGCCISQGTEGCSKVHATDETKRSSRGGSGNRVTFCSEELATGSVKRKERENIDEDDLPTEQILENSDHDNKPPHVLLREIDEDGNEKVISDHSTSAGFIFQNSLMYELD